MSGPYPRASDSEEEDIINEQATVTAAQNAGSGLPVQVMDSLWADEDDDEDYEDDGNFEDVEEDDDDDDDDEEFHDAEAEVEVFLEEGDDDEDEDEEGEGENANDDGEGGTAGERQPTTIHLTQRQLLTLLRGGGANLLRHFTTGSRRQRGPLDPNRFPKVPSDKGTELMASGRFGTDDADYMRRRKTIARRVLDRELGIKKTANREMMVQSMVPTSPADTVIHYGSPVYCGQFSDDGNFYYACVKDFRVRMYDTSNPYNWRYYKTVSYPFGSWTLTDAHLSPDNKWLAYTSLNRHVAFAPTDPENTGDPYTLDMGDPHDSGMDHGWRSRGNFGIFALRFSGDGRELVIGNNANSIIVYDIDSRQVLHNIHGHEDDVNAVCFADPKSPHIIYSGSDDQVIKVWDRRSMADGREVGAFVGHTQGITYVDSKGDGRYVLSNGKDQSMKLWDLRMAMSSSEYARKDPRRHTRHEQDDYRYGAMDERDWRPHPDDNSIVTYRGHKISSTLIRCHFSPPGSTNSRYVYSGSADGKVYIWNLDATLAGTINVKEATSGSQRQRRNRYEDEYEESDDDGDGWASSLIREPHWHPNAPIIAASSWVNSMSYGAVTVHSWNDAQQDDAEPKMGHKVNEHLVADPDMEGAFQDRARRFGWG